MLIRLRIDGFKNLRDVELRFGPLTCVAGRNGVGKSNLFDAIQLLSDLASMPLAKAATRVRGTGGRLSGIASLFDSSGSERPTLTLEADMVVPRQVQDDFDRPAEATATCLRYRLKLGLRVGDADDTGQPLELLEEDLRALSLEAASKELKFGPDSAWIKRFLKGPRTRTSPFINTTPDGVIQLWGDKVEGRAGRQAGVPAAKSPRTVLASVDASTHPTALAARREMQSWRQLQLEPSALRSPDDYRDEDRISHTGAHLPNALRRIGCGLELADLLSRLVPGVLAVEVDSDPARQQRMLRVLLRDRQTYDASSLSDGTLRFIALGLLGLDPLTTGLTCLEEPENGIHPQRIPEVMSLIDLLASDATQDTDDAKASARVSPRQVILNTHSPLVVDHLFADALLMADTVQFQGREWIRFKPLAGTWRAEGLRPTELVSKGQLKAYLRGRLAANRAAESPPGKRRVGDHVDELTRDLFSD
jgi:predicted ATPase